jgi:hypothetical protein
MKKEKRAARISYCELSFQNEKKKKKSGQLN